jgi:DNA-binding MarR family transcriptional regulator
MSDTGAARHELLSQVRDVLKAVRLFKQQAPPHRTVPSGTIAVLAGIDRIGTGSAECHVKDLAVCCALDPSTVSRAVAALVREGLVRRAADPADGRASTLTLTPHGRAALDETNDWYERHLAAALKDWSTEDVAAFTAFLGRFADDLMNHHDKTLEAAR